MERYFLGNNTAYGFVGNYENELKSMRKVILLKGGPGTGKSSILKKLVNEAKKRGLDYEMWYCSGDPQSLDGVYIKQLNSAVVDATAPHASCADLPAMKDFIVDLAQSLSSEKLSHGRDEIENLLSIKKRHFMRAYEHLKTALCHYDNILEIQSEGVKEVDIRSLAAMFAPKLRGESEDLENTKPRRVFTMAISPDGENVFYDHLRGKYVYGVGGCEKSVVTFFDELTRLIPGGMQILNPLDGKSAVGIVVGDTVVMASDMLRGEMDEEMNLGVYENIVDPDSVDEERGGMIVEVAKAVSHLNRAREAHLAAEKYFIAAMDFANNDRLYDEIAKAIFS